MQLESNTSAHLPIKNLKYLVSNILYSIRYKLPHDSNIRNVANIECNKSALKKDNPKTE